MGASGNWGRCVIVLLLASSVLAAKRTCIRELSRPAKQYFNLDTVAESDSERTQRLLTFSEGDLENILIEGVINLPRKIGSELSTASLQIVRHLGAHGGEKSERLLNAILNLRAKSRPNPYRIGAVSRWELLLSLERIRRRRENGISQIPIVMDINDYSNYPFTTPKSQKDVTRFQQVSIENTAKVEASEIAEHMATLDKIVPPDRLFHAKTLWLDVRVAPYTYHQQDLAQAIATLLYVNKDLDGALYLWWLSGLYNRQLPMGIKEILIRDNRKRWDQILNSEDIVLQLYWVEERLLEARIGVLALGVDPKPIERLISAIAGDIDPQDPGSFHTLHTVATKALLGIERRLK